MARSTRSRGMFFAQYDSWPRKRWISSRSSRDFSVVTVNSDDTLDPLFPAQGGGDDVQRGLQLARRGWRAEADARRARDLGAGGEGARAGHADAARAKLVL